MYLGVGAEGEANTEGMIRQEKQMAKLERPEIHTKGLRTLDETQRWRGNLRREGRRSRYAQLYKRA